MLVVFTMITLFSTNCPKCKVLEKKLNDKNIEYKIETDIDKMFELDITQVPMLMIDDKLYDFSKAVEWVNAYQS